MKFRRKSAESDAAQAVGELDDPVEATGPFDADELPQDGLARVDLGSLLIEPQEGRDLRLQVDESTGEVQAVVLAGPDGALDLRAFAAPRGGDLWSDIRPQIAAEMAQRGGTATEREGRFGTELLCELTTTVEGGGTTTQPSRIIGINGSRWLLRATLLGRPARDFEAGAVWEDTISRIAVRRGSGAMPVGDVLPVTLPEQARRVDPPTA